jgi:hypothetical protein
MISSEITIPLFSVFILALFSSVMIPEIRGRKLRPPIYNSGNRIYFYLNAASVVSNLRRKNELLMSCGPAVLRSCSLAVLQSCGPAVLRSSLFPHSSLLTPCPFAVLRSCGLAVLQVLRSCRSEKALEALVAAEAIQLDFIVRVRWTQQFFNNQDDMVIHGFRLRKYLCLNYLLKCKRNQYRRYSPGS